MPSLGPTQPTPQDPRVRAAGQARMLLEGATAGGLALGLSTATVILRPEFVLGIGFLTGDPGVNLFVADVLADGGYLYRDVAYPYGPVPAYLHAATAALAGNTALTYVRLMAGLSALSVTLAFIAVSRSTDLATARIAMIGLLPLLTIPTSILGYGIVSPYIPLERLVLLLVVLLWREPRRRSIRASIAMGAAIGSWQLVRFGGAAVCGLSVLVLDAVVLAASKVTLGEWRRWICGLAWTAGAVAVIEIVGAMIAFNTLPAGVAADVLWPAYLLRTWVPPGLRWPTFMGLKPFATQYLLPLSAGAVGLYAMRSALGLLRASSPANDRPARAPSALALYLPLIFFVFAALGYFRTDNHFRLFAWAFVPAAALGLASAGPSARIVILLLWLPSWVPIVSSWSRPTDSPGVIPKSVPKVGHLHLIPPEYARATFLEEVARSASDGSVLFLPTGSGWHYAYGVRPASRHTWFFSRYVVRPHEWEAFVLSSARASVVIYCPDTHGRFPLPAELWDRIAPSLRVSQERHGCRVLATNP